MNKVQLRRLSLTLLALAALARLAGAQSLGEIAAKEKERRKKAQDAGAPTRVITNDDLAKTKGQLANDPSAATTTTPEARRPSTVPAPPLGGVSVGLGDAGFAPPSAGSALALKEAFWRGEGQRRRAHVAESQRDLLGAERVSCPITRARLRKQAQEDIARAQESLANLEDDARRAGALPGWIRE